MGIERVSIRYSLLGYLSEGPSTGYQLHKIYPRPGKPSQVYIYRSLAEMAREGLVTCTSVLEKKRPLRNVFTITDAGLKELDRWLSTPLAYIWPRPNIFAQILFGNRCGSDRLIANIRGYQDQLKDLLNEVSQWHPQNKRTGAGRHLKQATGTLNQELAQKAALIFLEREVESFDLIIKEIRRLGRKPRIQDSPPGD